MTQRNDPASVIGAIQILRRRIEAGKARWSEEDVSDVAAALREVYADAQLELGKYEVHP